MILIHYGSDKYKPDLFLPIQNGDFTKPKGGLWTSPESSVIGWKDFCMGENFGIKKLSSFFRLNVKENARLVIINSMSDLLKLPKIHPITKHSSIYRIDFEKLAKNFDLLWLTENGLGEVNFHLCCWDCETVLVMNKNSIYQI